ncbi:disulfide oxidoreductase [Clostridia bacterium]|nr:disulfide oxidoreductase [Clostridia bacterium]
MAQLNKNTIIGDILDIDTGTAPFFFEIGMHCLGCPSSRNETLEQACAVHGVDPDALLNKLNGYLEQKKSA